MIKKKNDSNKYKKMAYLKEAVTYSIGFVFLIKKHISSHLALFPNSIGASSYL
jgi:hypothetical protein